MRPYDWTGVSLMRVCHMVKFFRGASGGDITKQKRLLEAYLNQCLKRNAILAQQNSPPLTFKELYEVRN